VYELVSLPHELECSFAPTLLAYGNICVARFPGTLRNCALGCPMSKNASFAPGAMPASPGRSSKSEEPAMVPPTCVPCPPFSPSTSSANATYCTTLRCAVFSYTGRPVIWSKLPVGNATSVRESKKKHDWWSSPESPSPTVTPDPSIPRSQNGVCGLPVKLPDCRIHAACALCVWRGRSAEMAEITPVASWSCASAAVKALASDSPVTSASLSEPGEAEWDSPDTATAQPLQREGLAAANAATLSARSCAEQSAVEVTRTSAASGTTASSGDTFRSCSTGCTRSNAGEACSESYSALVRERV
jgi:hypothetical protein